MIDSENKNEMPLKRIPQELFKALLSWHARLKYSYRIGAIGLAAHTRIRRDQPNPAMMPSRPPRGRQPAATWYMLSWRAIAEALAGDNYTEHRQRFRVGYPHPR